MTKESIRKILSAFNLNGSSLHWTPLTSGLINDTYLVTEDDGQQYILQKINTQVFKNAGILMDNIQFALPVLKKSSKFCVALYAISQRVLLVALPK